MSENKRLGGNYNPPQTPIEDLLKKHIKPQTKEQIKNEDKAELAEGYTYTAHGTLVKVTHVGNPVIWHDATGKPHDALVTAVWSPGCINLVFVSDDINKQDSYGRQIERATSCQHKSIMNVHGFYWRHTDEEPNEYVPALEK